MAKSLVFNPITGALDTISEITVASPAHGLSVDAEQVVTLGLSSSSTDGALSSTDWAAFDGKVDNAINELTGDATAGPVTGEQSASLTLATVNANVGSFGSSSSSPSVTVNAKGLVTAASSTSIQIAESQVTNLVSDLAGKQPTGNYVTDLTGDATASGPGSAALTLATVNSNVGSFGSASSVGTFTVNAKGLVTAAVSTSIAIPFSQVSGTVPLNQGGTGQTTKAAAFDALSPLTTKGDVVVRSATSNDRLPVGTDGQVLLADSTQTLGVKWDVSPSAPTAAIDMSNMGLSASVSGNALTISLTQADGTSAPSGASPVKLGIRDVTATSGAYTTASVSSALSVTVSSGSTLGTFNATPFRLWVVAFNDAGTVRLGVVNCYQGLGSIFPLSQLPLVSSTAEGGAGAADSAGVIYTSTAVSAKPFKILGYVYYSSGLATAGTWSSAPTHVVPFYLGMPMPGDFVQRQRTFTGTSQTGSTSIPRDDTIPQITEGDQYMSQTITPTSSANILLIRARAAFAASSSLYVTGALFQTGVSNALAACPFTYAPAVDRGQSNTIEFEVLAATTSSVTYTFRAGADGTSTLTFNGESAARRYGGVNNSWMSVEEIMV